MESGVGCTGETHQELSCRFQGNGRDHLRRREVHPFPEEQDQARFHLRIGGRGGAPRAARFVLLGYIL